MTLSDKQKTFSKLLSNFIRDLSLRGYEVTMGECYRPPEMAKIYAEQGKGIKNSLHCSRLAVDLNIFYNKVLLSTKEELLIPGKLWKSYGNELAKTCWGGDFTKVDANHFSILHNGIR